MPAPDSSDIDRYSPTPAEADLVARLRQALDTSDTTASAASRLALEVIHNIGSPHAELRDEVGIAALAKWIVEEDLLSPKTQLEILQSRLGPDGIYFKVGESDTDSVFRRSFSLLVAVLVIAADNERAFLSAADFGRVQSAFERYASAEVDFRAVVPGRGWAHALAHSADLADECGHSRYATPTTADVFAVGLGSMVDRCPHAFQGEEDERIARAFITLNQQFDDFRIAAWIGDGIGREAHTRINWKSIARSAYFQADGDPSARERLEAIQRNHTQ